MDPQISVIVLNYNTPELTTACVQSIIAHTSDISYEIIVVDNCSAPTNKEYFEKYLSDMPEVSVIYESENHGF